MQNEAEPRSLSSSSWTGISEGTPENPLDRHYLPPQSPMQRGEAAVAAFLMVLGVLLYGSWWFVLSFHSPLTPDPASGHTEQFSLFRASVGGIYVRELELLIGLFLLCTAFIMPGIYLLWRSERKGR